MLSTIFVAAMVMSAYPVAAPSGQQTGRRVLDQENDAALSSYINGGSSAYEWAQSVTAGVTGRLVRLELFVVVDPAFGDTAPSDISITLGSPGQANPPTWSKTVSLESGWNIFNLTSARIPITTGEEFTIGIHGQRANNFNPGIAISYGDQYAGGALYLNGTTSGSEGNDILFRTYVKADR
jgi:hypothetical protein